MWEPRRLTTLWAYTAYYRDSFSFNSDTKYFSVFPLFISLYIAGVKAFKGVDYSYPNPPHQSGETAGGKDSLSHNSDVKYIRVLKKIKMGRNFTVRRVGGRSSAVE
jgi:hypothetical protein